MSNATQGPKDTETAVLPRSTKYYIQTVVIAVERQLYSVPKQALTSQSHVFEGMFDVGDHSAGEGESDEKPIVLEGYKKEDFECLLEILLHRPLEPFPPAMSKQKWTSVLKLATIWQMDKVRTLAIDQLSPLDLSPIEKIQYAREHRVSAWLKEGIAVIAGNLDDYRMEEIGNTLGWQTTALILFIRDKAKPKGPKLEGWMNRWECACGRNLDSGIINTSQKQYIQCSNIGNCRAVFIQTKEPASAVSDGPSASEKERVEISEDAISAAFAEEIKALDAYIAS
ncbi:hypothetical protein BKA70DRAFT_1280143 [Coprinopsis sp. MPI-PUGE-AT-0042]|nr:hypothetical protein BKA70DRAFT_1280143 [Coprinopsis sp. MPI-PUGE-AT-0042]